MSHHKNWCDSRIAFSKLISTCARRAYYQWNCVPASHIQSPWWVSCCRWKTILVFNIIRETWLTWGCLLVCSSSGILVLHCVLWDGCPGWGDVQGAVHMSDSDRGRLRGSIRRGSLLLGPAEQCSQDREHRESQVFFRLLIDTLSNSLLNHFLFNVCRYDKWYIFPSSGSTLAKVSSWSVKVKEMSGCAVWVIMQCLCRVITWIERRDVPLETQFTRSTPVLTLRWDYGTVLIQRNNVLFKGPLTMYTSWFEPCQVNFNLTILILSVNLISCLAISFWVFVLSPARCLTCVSATGRCSSRQRRLRQQLQHRQQLWLGTFPGQALWEASHPPSVSVLTAALSPQQVYFYAQCFSLVWEG